MASDICEKVTEQIFISGYNKNTKKKHTTSNGGLNYEAYL